MFQVTGNAKNSTPTAPTFSSDRSETQNQGRYPGYDAAQKMVDVGRQEGSLRKCANFGLLLILKIKQKNHLSLRKTRYNLYYSC